MQLLRTNAVRSLVKLKGGPLPMKGKGFPAEKKGACSDKESRRIPRLRPYSVQLRSRQLAAALQTAWRGVTDPDCTAVSTLP